MVSLVDVTVTTASQTVSLQSGKKLSDYKTLALCILDGTIVCGSVFIGRNVFASNFKVTTNGYSLANYHAAVICSYSSDTAVQIYAREMVGWTSIRCILYGIN